MLARKPSGRPARNSICLNQVFTSTVSWWIWQETHRRNPGNACNGGTQRESDVGVSLAS